MTDDLPKSQKTTFKDNLDLFGKQRTNLPINFSRYSFVTKSLIFSLIYFVFTLLFIIVSGILGLMISYFLFQYNLVEKVLSWQLWQKVAFFGGCLFLVANFCLFEAEALVKHLIKERNQDDNKDDLRKYLKIHPNNWQKIFYSILLIAFSLLIGYLYVINYISWSYTQFWE
jgi:hypothetical protein